MTNQQHPITPPPELVQQWLRERPESEYAHTYIATQAARWGADQELEAEGPTDEELAALMPTRFLVNQSASARAIANIGTDEQVAQVRAILDGEAIAYARAVLARWGHPTPQPVAVSERLPGPEDCNEQGRCWLGGRQMGSGTPTWLLGYPAWAERFPDVHRFWLPANALPLPAPEGGEVRP